MGGASYINRTYRNDDDSMGNVEIQSEDNFSILPDGVEIWEKAVDGSIIFPFIPGSKFPTDAIQQRADEYKTIDMLYKNKLDAVYGNIVSINDMMRDAVTNFPILRLVPNLPDYKLLTEAWVDLTAAKPPRVESDDSIKQMQLSQVIGASNFAEAYRSVVRGSQIMYGNKTFKVDKLSGGRVKIVDMPLKCWVPFVNKEDTSTIACNVFFNIFVDNNQWFCEFVCYEETGDIYGLKFKYNKRRLMLEELVEEFKHEQAFNGKGISPIVVFHGDRLNNELLGQSRYKEWDSAIASCIRAYQTILILLERCKEIIRVLPSGATKTDDYTGLTYSQQTGSIAYEPGVDKKAPEIKFEVPVIPMEQAILAYGQCLERLSRDTGLPGTFLNLQDIKTGTSGETVKSSMIRSEIKAKGMNTLLNYSTKALIHRIAIASNLDIDIGEFDIKSFNGFVQNEDSKSKILQARLGSSGNIATMTIADAIAEYDDVPMSIAKQREQELKGIKVEQTTIDIHNSESGKESEVTNGISFTPKPGTIENSSNVNTEGFKPVGAFIMGSENIGDNV